MIPNPKKMQATITQILVFFLVELVVGTTFSEELLGMLFVDDENVADGLE